MKNIILSIFITFFSLSAFATHFVGGDFQICQVGPNTFQVTLRVYRDCLFGNSTIINPSSVVVRDNVTNAQISSFSMTNNLISQTVLALGDSCYTPTGICVEEYVFVKTITLANNPNGYYLEWDDCCRNSLIDNLATPGSEGMTYYAQIPDPALAGGNCTPNFGSYPSDGYLCIGYDQQIDWGVTDADGDSLVFSLITPYSDALGAAKPFPTCAWAGGYNLGNILGNTVQAPMSIDPQTGVISCHAEFLGVFVFSVMVKEYRNNVQIGEVVRDVQYKSLGCVLDAPPQIVLDDSVQIYVSDSICVDMYVFDADGTDTIYLSIQSTDFDLAGTYVNPSVSSGSLYYPNFQNTTDTLWINYLDTVNNIYQGLGYIPTRYCWSPGCVDLDSTYHVSLLAYSIGCSGSDTTMKDVVFQVAHDAAPVISLGGLSDTVNVTVSEQICFDIVIADTVANDTINVVISSSEFDLLGNYIMPTDFTTLSPYYTNFFGSDTLWLDYYSFTASSNQVIGVDTIALRYCWTPNCQEIDSTFIITIEAFTTGCGASDTISQDFVVNVNFTPPQFELNIPSLLEVTYGEDICFEILAQDLSQSGLVLTVEPVNSNFDFISSYLAPTNGQYYTNFMGVDTFWVNNYVYDPNEGVVTAIGAVPIKYCWTPNCVEVLAKEYDLTYVAWMQECGIYSVTKNIHVVIDIPQFTVEYPNVFSPNGDGKNDKFKLVTKNDACFENISAVIYNRWGKVVFETIDVNFEWDGKNKQGAKCREGVYYIILTGSYKGNYSPITGEREEVIMDQSYTIQLFR